MVRTLSLSGDVKSAIIHTMTERGIKYVSRIILPDGLMYPPGFGIDGKGTLYITMGIIADQASSDMTITEIYHPTILHVRV